MPLSIQELLAPKVNHREQEIINFLDRDKSGELFELEELVKAAQCSNTTIWRLGLQSRFAGYKLRFRNRVYFGKPSTVAAFKKAAGIA